LITQRIADLEEFGYIRPVFTKITADDRWNCTGTTFKIDIFALTAFLSYLSALTTFYLEVIEVGDNACKINIDSHTADIIKRYSNVFDAICLWGDLEYSIVSNSINFVQRFALV